jgi:hypothetical protein
MLIDGIIGKHGERPSRIPAVDGLPILFQQCRGITLARATVAAASIRVDASIVTRKTAF